MNQNSKLNKRISTAGKINWGTEDFKRPKKLHTLENSAVITTESPYLLNRTGYVGECSICVGSDQPDCSYHQDKNNCQHYGILRNVLSLIFRPYALYKVYHNPP